MARPNVLFLVHGVGEHRGGWSQLPKTTLREAAASYACFPSTLDPLEQEIEFIEIRYDDIFDLVLERFQNLTNQFKRVDPGLIPAQLQGILDTLNDLDGVGARYAGDVLLYRLKLVSTTVLLRVMKRITETVARIGLVDAGQPVKYGILGHSLGTTVVHDALHLLATQPVISSEAMLAELRTVLPELADDYVQDFGANPFSAGTFQFEAIYMVSNTSRLLHTTDKGPYESLVRPYRSVASPGACASFYNIDHRWDPVSKVKPFRLADAWGGDASDATQIEVEHVYQVNIHALDHYLMNPKVHAAIFGHLAGSFGPDDWDEAEERVTSGTFKRWGPDFDLEAKKQELRNKLQAKVDAALGDSRIEKLRELLAQVKAL